MIQLARYAPYIAIAALALFAWFQHTRIQTLDVALDSTTEKLADARQDIAQAKLDLSTAVETAHKNALSLSKMQAAQNSFRADLSQREAAIGNMQRDIEEIRNWADQPLPADIAGLRKRPAITGSGAYAEFMSKRYAVPAARSEPENERGFKPGP